GATTSLVVNGSIMLMGGGEVLLSDSSTNAIVGDGAGETLINVDNTIAGSGHIGGEELTLVNEGLIDAIGTNALVIDTGANAILNNGTLETDGSTLIVESAVIGGGNAVINGGTMEFAAASDANVSFDAGHAGTLQLDASTLFTGQIAGLAAADAIDFRDIVFG